MRFLWSLLIVTSVGCTQTVCTCPCYFSTQGNTTTTGSACGANNDTTAKVNAETKCDAINGSFAENECTCVEQLGLFCATTRIPSLPGDLKPIPDTTVPKAP
jgi:hypothetical protein